MKKAKNFEEFLNALIAKEVPLFFEDKEQHLVYFVEKDKAYIIKESDWQNFLNKLEKAFSIRK